MRHSQNILRRFNDQPAWRIAYFEAYLTPDDLEADAIKADAEREWQEWCEADDENYRINGPHARKGGFAL